MDPTIVGGMMFRGDTMRAPIDKRGSTSQPYNESIIVHIKNSRGMDSSKLMSSILKGI